MYKKVFMSILFFVVGLGIFLFAFSDSYKLSLKARVKYFLGEYKEAKVLAKQAFELDPYNKMAFSILTQSKISATLIDYIKDSKRYLKKIETLSSKGNFSNSDKIKIKMFCEIQMGKYDKLTPTIMTDKDLSEESKKYYKKFKDIHEELF